MFKEEERVSCYYLDTIIHIKNVVMFGKHVKKLKVIQIVKIVKVIMTLSI